MERVPEPITISRLLPLTQAVPTTPLEIPATSLSTINPPTPEECEAIGREKLSQLGEYFGIHNGKSITPEEGRNFTIETLYYMSPNSVGKATASIVRSMMERNFRSEYEVIEVCGGIGGNTMSFLDDPAVTKVITYEAREDRRRMLLNNLQDYGFDPNRYEIRENAEAYPADDEGLPVYIDPPWLPKGTPFCAGPEFYSQDISFGGMDLEGWIRRYNAAAFTIVRTPVLYWVWRRDDSAPIAGFERTLAPRPKAWFYIFRPTGVRKLREYLRTRLLPIMGVQGNHILAITTEKAMETWLVAFTHSSADRNRGRNYEQLETLGDGFAKAAFIGMLVEKFPDITEEAIGNLVSFYLSKESFSMIARTLEVPRYTISKIDIDKHIREDILESVFGALVRTGDAIKKGFGFVLVSNAIASLIPPSSIDIVRHGRQSSKTTFIQAFKQTGWGNPIITESDNRGVWTITISLPRLAIDAIRRRSPEFGKVLASVTAQGKDRAEREVYAKALANLSGLGYTPESIAEDKVLRSIASLRGYEAALAKARSSGFASIEFPPPRKGKKATFVQLVGVRPNGYRMILETIEDTGSLASLRENALIKYLGSARISPVPSPKTRNVERTAPSLSPLAEVDVITELPTIDQLLEAEVPASIAESD